MGEAMEVLAEVLSEENEDGEDTSMWATQLLAELADVDGTTVDPLPGEEREGSKGLGTVAGRLLAKLSGASSLRALVDVVRAFASRTGRTVEVTIDGDTLKVTGASREVQQLAIESWLARHPGT